MPVNRGRSEHGGRESAIGVLHPSGMDKLRQALMEVGCAAAKVWLQAEDRGIVVCKGEVTTLDRDEHLVRLLVVLVGTHVSCHCGRQQVVGQQLEPVRPSRLSENPK